MEPISATLGLVGLGVSLFGGIMGASDASKAAGINQDIAAQEIGVNSQKRQQMVLNSRRQQLENMRNVQKSRSLGLTNATSDGSQFGTGLKGGQAAATDQGGVNALGFSQNLQIGQNIFALDDKIDQDKSQLAGVQADQAMWGAVAGAGSSISKSSSLFGNLFAPSPSGGGGNYSGTPGASNTGGLY